MKLVDANPSAPHLEGAAFDVGKNATFQDTRRGIRVQLLEKTQGAYRVLVSRQ